MKAVCMNKQGSMQWQAAIIAGILWLQALQQLYTIGWLKSLLIAVVVWIVTTLVGVFLPMLTGPI
jgi:hypothetical protein